MTDGQLLDANVENFSGQDWRLLGQGDREGQGHGRRASAEQEPC